MKGALQRQLGLFGDDGAGDDYDCDGGGDGGGDGYSDGDDGNGDNIVDGSSLKGVRSLSAAVGSDLTSNHKSSTTIAHIDFI